MKMKTKLKIKGIKFLAAMFAITMSLSMSARSVLAHCPLCTVGAAVAAGGATYLGVNDMVVGLFIGAFAVSLGWWVSKFIKKQYIPYQKAIIIIFSFVTTVLPLLATTKGVSSFSFYVSLVGDYGSLLNRTYVINSFLIGSIFGGTIVSITPWLSRQITGLRSNKIFPFQGIILTFILLIIAGVVIQFIRGL